MINKIQLKNFGPLARFDWQETGPINLVIGGNSTGKTFILKALYSSMKTLEEYKRGNEQRTASQILADKLYWTFQAEKIGDLVTKGADSSISLNMTVDEKLFCYSFGKDTSKKIASLENHVAPRSSNSMFLPAKEVLSLHNIILQSRELDNLFGFDDTYLDLVKALQKPLQRGKNHAVFSKSRKQLEEMFAGKVEYDNSSKSWFFKKGNQKFPIGVTAEGIKKIAILDTLLGNKYLTPESIIFIDEPESALHPNAISKLLDIIAILADGGIQFFIASHSYFVIKKLHLIAQKKNIKIPVASFNGENWQHSDLLQEMPENPIINESIRLYEDEVGFALR